MPAVGPSPDTRADGRYRNARASITLQAARAALIREVVELWAGRCNEYNTAYWAALHELILSVVAEVCAGQDEVAEIAG